MHSKCARKAFQKGRAGKTLLANLCRQGRKNISPKKLNRASLSSGPGAQGRRGKGMEQKMIANLLDKNTEDCEKFLMGRTIRNENLLILGVAVGFETEYDGWNNDRVMVLDTGIRIPLYEIYGGR